RRLLPSPLPYATLFRCLLEEWLMGDDFAPEIGRKFTFRRQPNPDVDIVIDCQVLEIEPNRTLSYSWSAFGLESVVTFTLEPVSRDRKSTRLNSSHVKIS